MTEKEYEFVGDVTHQDLEHDGIFDFDPDSADENETDEEFFKRIEGEDDD
jgi:hypothetical protein